MSVGSRIKELRESRHMSQVALADKINVSKQTLYKYENDIITNVPSDKIEAIGDVFKVSPQYIMGWENTSSAEIIIQDENEAKLVRSYRKYNATGKAKLMDYVADLNDSPRNFGEVSDSSTDITEKDDSGSFGRRA